MYRPLRWSVTSEAVVSEGLLHFHEEVLVGLLPCLIPGGCGAPRSVAGARARGASLLPDDTGQGVRGTTWRCKLPPAHQFHLQTRRPGARGIEDGREKGLEHDDMTRAQIVEVQDIVLEEVRVEVQDMQVSRGSDL